MHCHLLLTILPLLVAANGQESGRRRGLGTSQYESVSSEPLTFEVAAPEPVDRERLLAEEADVDVDEHPYEILEGMDLLEGEDEWISMDEFDGEDDSVDDDLDGDLYEDYEDFDYVDGEEYVGGEEEDKFFDSAYESDDGVEYFAQDENGDEEEGEGFEEVGEAKDVNEPITRKLRRLDNPAVEEEMDEERYLAEKESLRDDSIPIFQPTQDENEEFELGPYAGPEYQEEMKLSFDEHVGRDLQTGCSGQQQRVKVEILTDNSGYENSWEIRRANGALLSEGPPNGSNYASNQRYIGGMCLSPGSYRFIVNDKFKDGMCGTNTGQGLYRFYIAGAMKFTSPANCSLNWGQRVHTFTIEGSSSNNSSNNSNNSAVSSRSGCYTVKVQFKIDKYGKETTVTLSGNGQTHLSSIKDVGAYETKTLTKCVPAGTYSLRLVDQDGICCSKGQGWYKMFVDGNLVVGGGYFAGSKTHTIKIGSNWQGSMSSRDQEWLNAHNARRRKYNGGVGYVALRWSSTLESNAKGHATYLANNCNGELVHAKGVSDGENMAKNMGVGSWGEQYTADKIVGRWVENELTWDYPRNAHYTQVVWRATQYVGCGEAMTNLGNNKVCRTQVCRYARAGNCNVRNGNWRAEAWKDDTGCGNPCPSEGCFI